MDISEIRKLIRLIQQSDVTEIEVTEGESTVRISRQGAAVAPTMVAAAQPMMAAPVAAGIIFTIAFLPLLQSLAGEPSTVFWVEVVA